MLTIRAIKDCTGKVLVGKAEDLLLELPVKSVDVVVTSPPYNLGKDYGGQVSDRIAEDDYNCWLLSILYRTGIVLKDGGSIFLNLGGKPSDASWAMRTIMNALPGSLLRIQNVIHWVKAVTMVASEIPTLVDNVTVGQYTPIQSGKYLAQCHEFVFHLTKAEAPALLDKLAVGVPYKDKANVSRWESVKADLRDRGNVWVIPYETKAGKEKTPHPAVFPAELAAKCIKLHGVDPDLVVLDPFIGSGSTAVAAQRLGVRWIGMDTNPEYSDLTQLRVLKEKTNALSEPV